jgi:uncharacterized protein YhdP
MRTEGVEFNKITSKASFDNGIAKVEKFFFDSSGLDVRGSGTANLVKEELDLTARLQLISTLHKIVRFVPLVGRGASDLATIHYRIRGSWDDPEVLYAPAMGVTESGKELLKAPRKILDGVRSTGSSEATPSN